MTKLFGDDSDHTWRWFGEHDPYYGVLSGPEYHKANLTPDRIQSFFASGSAHVERVIAIALHHLGDFSRGSCLDFGCGVGRLVIPFASKFQRVTGVDVSPAMIAEAKRNSERFNVRNANFTHSLDEVHDKYDLVHSYIVLQHIPARRGMSLIHQLIDCTAPNGVCFLHITIGRNRGRLRDLATFLRKNVKPAHWILNLTQGQPVFQPYMQANLYDLHKLIPSLYERHIRQLWVETEVHGGPYSVCLAFRP